MKTLAFALLLTLSTSLRTEAQATLGSLTYNLVKGAGREFSIRDATGTVQKGDLFLAELWAGKAPADESSLSAVSGTLFQWAFPVGTTRFGDSSARVEIPGTQGGDTGIIQLRVWKATVADWQSAVSQNLPRGASPLASLKLGGASADGTLTLPLAVGPFLEGFSIIPEPSTLALIAIGGTALLISARNRRAQKRH